MTAPAQAPEPAVDRAARWDRVYATKQPTALSWYEPEPTHSLELIAASGLPASGSIIDVGGGMSSLGASLVALGYSDVSVADISAAALDHGRTQTGRVGETSRGSMLTSAPTTSSAGTTSGTTAPSFTSWSSQETETPTWRRCTAPSAQEDT